MSTYRLTPNYNLANKVYTSRQSQKRMYEVLPAVKEGYKQAIFVHGTPIDYYFKIPHGYTCTCMAKPAAHDSQSPNKSDISNIEAPPITRDGEYGETVTFTYRETLFGESSYDDNFEKDQILENPPDLNAVTYGPDNNGMTDFVPSILTNSVDCGICYRTGIIPGYYKYGHIRQVFSTHNYVECDGFFIDHAMHPSIFENENSLSSKVTFSTDIPRNFTSVSIQVYNNRDLLDTLPVNSSTLLPLDVATLRANAGRKLIFSIIGAYQFTHVVFNYKLSNTQLLADFPQDNRTLDFTMFDTLGGVSIVIPHTVGKVSHGDVVVNRLNGSMWKITDFTYYRMKEGMVLGWQLSSRLIQPDETVRLLDKSTSLN